MWVYNGNEINQDYFGIDQSECEHYGFVYIVTNHLTGRKYVGKKVLWSKRTLPPLKGKKRKRIVIKPSDWMKYWGSSKVVMADMERFGKDVFSREIIGLYPDKRETNYAELCFQIYANVLGEVDSNGNRVWYNENIDRVYYNSVNYSDHRKRMHDKLNEQFSPNNKKQRD